MSYTVPSTSGNKTLEIHRDGGLWTFDIDDPTDGATITVKEKDAIAAIKHEAPYLMVDGSVAGTKLEQIKEILKKSGTIYPADVVREIQMLLYKDADLPTGHAAVIEVSDGGYSSRGPTRLTRVGNRWLTDTGVQWSEADIFTPFTTYKVISEGVK